MFIHYLSVVLFTAVAFLCFVLRLLALRLLQLADKPEDEDEKDSSHGQEDAEVQTSSL